MTEPVAGVLVWRGADKRAASTESAPESVPGSRKTDRATRRDRPTLAATRARTLVSERHSVSSAAVAPKRLCAVMSKVAMLWLWMSRKARGLLLAAALAAPTLPVRQLPPVRRTDRPQIAGVS